MPLKVTRLPDFTAGLVNKRVNPLNAPENSVSLGENIDLSEGGIKVRPGYTLAHNAATLVGTVSALSQANFPTNEITYTVAQGEALSAFELVTVAAAKRRSDHSMVWDVDNSRYLIFGGTDGTSFYLDTVLSYEPVAGTITVLATAGVCPGRMHHTAVYNSADAAMYVFGGATAAGVVTDKLHRLDCGTLTWTEIALSGTAPAARMLHDACLVSPSVMLVNGGATGAFLPNFSASTYYEINLITGVCTEIVGTADSGMPSVLSHHTLSCSSSAVYMIGGISGAGGAVDSHKKLWSLNRTTHHWTRLADLPIDWGIWWQQAVFCSGRIYCLGGNRGDISDDYVISYSIANNTWRTDLMSVSPGLLIGHSMAVADDGTFVIYGGQTDETPAGEDLMAQAWLSTTPCLWQYGIFASNTHLPTTTLAFEFVKGLQSTSGVCTFAVLGDRLIITEGITDVPHVFLPGTLSSDPVGSWAQPMRVLVTYDGSTYHDVSDKVLDNDLDSVADIGGIVTRGAILICCDVPVVYGFYFEFETPNTLAGSTTEFSDDVTLNDLTDISREDIGNGINRWYKDAAGTGHFEGSLKAISGNAVDNGGALAGTVKIPIVGHGQVNGNVVEIRNTVAYDGTYTLGAQTGGDVDNLIIVHAFVVEAFAGDDEMRQRFTLDTGNNAPLVEPGVVVDFGSGVTVTIVSITDDGEASGEVTISADHVTATCDLYGIVVNDSDVVTVATSTDVPTSLVAYTPNSKAWHATKSIRQVVKAADYASGGSFVRLKFNSGDQWSTYNTGAHIIAASIVERSGTTAAGTTTPTAVTFNNGSASVDIPRTYPAWVTGTVYTKDYKVTESSIVYVCLLAHTAGGVFANDLAAGKWAASGDALGYVYSDIIAFTFDETKDYLIIYDLDTGTGYPSGGGFASGGSGTSEATTNWSNLALLTKAYGDTHYFYGYAGQATASTQTPTGTVTTTYGILGVTEIQGLGAITPVTELHVATTTDTSQLDMTGADSIKQISVTETKPGTSKAYYALSVDQRQTYLIHNGTAIRTIAKLESATWRYINGADAWVDTGLADPYTALRLAFAIAQNQMTGTNMAARTEAQWSPLVGYPTLDFALAIQADGNNLSTVTKFTVRVYDTGGSAVKGMVAGNFSEGVGWTDNTVSGGATFGQNGTILYDGAGGFEADYGVIAGIPGYWYKAEMRGTAVGTSLTKVRYRAPCQPLQNIGSGQPVAPMVVFHDTSAGKILDYSIQLADETYTELASAVVPLETDDFLYVGYLTPFTELELIMFEDNNDVISSLEAAYWNGTAWTELTIIDGTSADGKTLRQRGKIKFAVPSAWKSNIPLEGLTASDDSNGRMEIMYWLQFSVSANITSTTAIAEAKVQPVPTSLVKYRHAATFQNRVALANRADAPDQVAVSQPFLEYVWNGPWAANYRLGGGAVTSLLSAWNTLLAGQVDRSVLISQVSGQDSDMTPVEAARHVPVNRQSIVSAPMTGADDGSRSGLFFLNRYGAYCVTGLQADPNFATARFQVLSDGVNWWESTGYPRLDLDYIHLACGEYWPARNWIVWSVPMIIDYAFDPSVAVVQSTTKVKIKHTGHGRTAGDIITITGMTNYSNTYTLHADTTTDWLIFTATYVAETTTRLARYSVSGAAQTTNNRLLVYDLSMGGWLPPFTIAAASICTAYEYNANSPGKLGALRLLAGNYTGQILDLFDPAATSDNGTAISAFMDTQWMTHADPEHTPEWTKEFRKLYLYGTTDNNFYIDIQKDGGTTSLSTLTETALTDPVLYSFVKAFQHVDGGTIKANLFKYRFTFSGPAHVQAAKLALGYERNELSTT